MRPSKNLLRIFHVKLSLSICPLVLKHGLLENLPFADYVRMQMTISWIFFASIHSYLPSH